MPTPQTPARCDRHYRALPLVAVLLGAVLALTPTAGRADAAVESPPEQTTEAVQVLILHHRTAAQLLPIVRPLLARDTVLTGDGYRLLVRGSDADLQTLRTLLPQLDRPPRSLLISVQRDGDDHTARRAAALESRPDGTGLRARIAQTEDRHGSSNIQQVRTLDGQPAFIETGDTLTVVDQGVYAGRAGVAVQHQHSHTEHFGRGVYLTPRLSADGAQVTLELRYLRRVPAAQGASQEQLLSTVHGAVGQWLELGGVRHRKQHTGSGIVHRSAQRTHRDSGLRVKVELLPTDP